LISDNIGNQILHFAFEGIPPHGIKIVTIAANLMLSDKANPIQIDNVPAYIEPQKYIEADHAEIKKLAADLNASTPMKTAQKTFQWVSKNTNYAGYIKNDRGALYALRQKKGDCTEFMYLFVALCRANRIPARPIGEYICRNNCILKPSGYHNWAEFYDAGSWYIVYFRQACAAKNILTYRDWLGTRLGAGTGPEAENYIA